MEKIKNGFKNSEEWCKEHWKLAAFLYAHLSDIVIKGEWIEYENLIS